MSQAKQQPTQIIYTATKTPIEVKLLKEWQKKNNIQVEGVGFTDQLREFHKYLLSHTEEYSENELDQLALMMRHARIA